MSPFWTQQISYMMGFTLKTYFGSTFVEFNFFSYKLCVLASVQKKNTNVLCFAKAFI